MLKEKKFVEGKNLEAVVDGEKIESFHVKGVESKEELENLIEELQQLKDYGIIKKDKDIEDRKENVAEKIEEEEKKENVAEKEKKKGKKEEKDKKKEEERKATLKELLKEIEEKYPNKEVPSAEFRENNLALYNKATKATKESGITLKDFLEGEGFAYLRKKRGVKAENPK